MLSSVGLVGLGAVCNYLGAQNQLCPVDMPQTGIPYQPPSVVDEQRLVNIGDMYIQEDSELSLDEVFNRYDIYEASQSTALVKSNQNMPPAVNNSPLLGRKDDFSL